MTLLIPDWEIIKHKTIWIYFWAQELTMQMELHLCFWIYIKVTKTSLAPRHVFAS